MDKSAAVRKVIMTVLTLLVISYVIYVICRTSFTQVKTVTAKESTAYQSITTDCYIIRDETLIEYNGDGVISYNIEDGEKVSVNEAVAGVFDSVNSAGAKQEISRLKEQIEALTQLQKNADVLTQSPDEIDKSIDSYLVQINNAIRNGELSQARSHYDNICYYINERQLITGKTSDYKDRINSMQARVKELEAASAKQKKSKDIKAPSTGYFVSTADGYENLFTEKQLKEIMPGDTDKENLKPKSVSDKVIGKTINGVYWYAACKVNSEDAIKIKNAGELRLDIPTVSAEKISVELYSLNQKSKSSEALAIFRGTFMNNEMASLRTGEISIILNEYHGISIPKSAIHEQTLTKTTKDSNGKEQKETETVTGVYVKIGNEVVFRQIIPIYSGENIVISSLDKNEQPFSEEVNILELYDEIIVEGANLYDGKIIGRTA